MERGPAFLLIGLVGCNAIFGLEPSSLESTDAGRESSGKSSDSAVSVPDAFGAGSTSGADRSGSSTGSGTGSASGSAGSSGAINSGSSTGAGSSGQRNADGGGPLDCPVCAPGLACERTAGATCADATWAQWPMANAARDVVAGAPNPHQFTDNLNGTVTDLVTGLIWQQAVPPGTYSQPNAVAYCKGIGLTGHHDWRLPSEIELISIVDHDQSSPSIDAVYFPDTPSFPFWSATGVSASTVAWGVTFIFGSVGSNNVNSTNYVRCVR